LNKKYAISAIIIILLIHSAQILSAKDKTRIAILDFTSENSPETYGRSVRNLFEVSLYKTGNFDILERNKIESILKEQGFQMSGCIDTSCAVEIGRLLSANIVVIGSLNKISKYIITVKFINIAEGKIDLADSETAGTEDDIQDAVNRLAGRMAGNLSNAGKGTEAKKTIPEKKDENKVAATGLHVTYGITATGAYFFPKGNFSDIAKYGYGIDLIFGMKNFGFNKFISGINTGFYYFPGEKKNVEYTSIIPVLAITGYSFELKSFDITPLIGAGIGYNILSYDKDGIGTGEPAKFATETAAELLVKAGLNLDYNINNNIVLLAGANYLIIFEKENNLTSLGISAGIKYYF
jgi:hypothetical protein